MRSPQAPAGRLLHVDALKALAAQAIVLHHLSAYGPLADAVHGLVPAVVELLYRHGRLAVQVFLVVGGFLSARSLSRRGGLMSGNVPALLCKRWLRLTLPFMAAVVLTVLVGALLRPWLGDLVPEQVGWRQLLAHALLLHGVLGHEALTVGAWYVAADFQLFALLALLLWLARSLPLARERRQRLGPWLVLALMVASLWGFNRFSDLDDWGLYFFGAYGLGALVHWIGIGDSRRRHMLILSAIGIAALLIEWRERVAVALVTAWVLAWLQARHQAGQRLSQGWIVEAGDHSYALFLVHYPICLLVNALFVQWDLQNPYAALAMMAMAWVLANMASLLFHHYVERPAMQLGASEPVLRRAQEA
ncbi:acyltransferase family protein [Burkholderiaceae bacterium UC74_6]